MVRFSDIVIPLALDCRENKVEMYGGKGKKVQYVKKKKIDLEQELMKIQMVVC